VCDGTVLPHCGHLLNCRACQRLAALRVRNRIFEVFRFGTPMVSRLSKHGFRKKQIAGPAVETLKRWRVEAAETCPL
jgi:hypothetical protein